MQATNAGYKDPNDLKFENITILGVTSPPKSVLVPHATTRTEKGFTKSLEKSNIHYDDVKKVNTDHTVFYILFNFIV